MASTEQTKKSRETLVQFGEHKPIRRVGRLRCTLLSTKQSKKSRETLVQFGEHKTIKKSRETVVQFGEHKTTREKSGDCGAIWISLEKSRETVVQFGEHNKIVEFNPQRDDGKF